MSGGNGGGKNGGGDAFDDFDALIRDRDDDFEVGGDWDNPRADYDPYEDFRASQAGRGGEGEPAIAREFPRRVDRGQEARLQVDGEQEEVGGMGGRRGHGRRKAGGARGSWECFSAATGHLRASHRRGGP